MMMKAVLILMVSVILFSSSIPVFADEGFLDGHIGQQLFNQPTLCLFEPHDIELSQYVWDNWKKEAKIASDEWENRLKNSNLQGNWEINWVEIPKEKLSFVNYSGCDLKIYFIDSKRTDAKGWYSSTQKTIEIVRNQMTYCGKVEYENYNFYVNVYCRGDDLERASKMANTLKHELGHAFGLGHYVSTNPQLMQDWYDYPSGAPSIMAIFSPDNEEVRNISLLDLQTVGEIHGPYGFGKNSNPNPVFIYPEPEIKEPELLGSETINVKPYQRASTTIVGDIPERLYSRGTPAEFHVTKPDGTTDVSAIHVTKHQHFEYLMMFNSKSQMGKYEIIVMYKDEPIQKNIVYVQKSTSSGTNLSSSSISAPSTTGQYIENISVESVNDEYTVKGNFGKLPPTSSSVRIIAENECPAKKEVFRKDFLFRSGTEFSFSFQQLSQGKPSECSVHLELSNFDGQVIDTVAVDYTIEEKQQTNLESKKVPDWVKNNVQWWSEGQIDDDSFVQGMQYLIKEKIMDVDPPQELQSTNADEIPEWIRNNAKWWVQGQISESDFVTGMQYLVSTGVIQLQNNISADTVNQNSNSIMVEGTKFSIDYEINGGTIYSITPNLDANSLIINIDTINDGSLTVTLPRDLIDAKIGDADDDFFVLMDRDEIPYDRTSTSQDRTITVYFEAGVEEIEIIGTYVDTN